MGETIEGQLPPNLPRLRVRLAGLAMLAGVIHLWVGPAHLAEWWGYGLFFAVVAALQLAYGALWLSLSLDVGRIRLLGLLGIALHLGLFGLYVVTRTLGVPLVGPGAGQVEPVGVVDVASKLVELALVGMLARMLHELRVGPRESRRPVAGP